MSINRDKANAPKERRLFFYRPRAPEKTPYDVHLYLTHFPENNGDLFDLAMTLFLKGAMPNTKYYPGEIACSLKGQCIPLKKESYAYTEWRYETAYAIFKSLAEFHQYPKANSFALNIQKLMNQRTFLIQTKQINLQLYGDSSVINAIIDELAFAKVAYPMLEDPKKSQCGNDIKTLEARLMHYKKSANKFFHKVKKQKDNTQKDDKQQNDKADLKDTPPPRDKQHPPLPQKADPHKVQRQIMKV